jgi:preprotein translocase subunit SecB
MKPKIKPEEYNRILASLELKTMFLRETRTRFDEGLVKSEITIDVSETSSFEQKPGMLEVEYAFKLTGRSPEITTPCVTLHAKYLVRYKVSGTTRVTKEFMNVFSEMTVATLLWSYFREFVNNMVYRMGLPPLILPLKRR